MKVRIDFDEDDYESNFSAVEFEESPDVGGVAHAIKNMVDASGFREESIYRMLLSEVIIPRGFGPAIRDEISRCEDPVDPSHT